jgi:hypothetical protein
MKDLEYIPLEGIHRLLKQNYVFSVKGFYFFTHGLFVWRPQTGKAKSFIHILISVLHTRGKSSSITLCKILLILHYFNSVY